MQYSDLQFIILLKTARFISDRADFESKTVKRYILVKGSIQQEYTAIVNICALNTEIYKVNIISKMKDRFQYSNS
jgi:hypothetical protein